MQEKRELKTYCFSMIFENSERLPALVIVDPYPVVKHTTTAISAHAKGVGYRNFNYQQNSIRHECFPNQLWVMLYHISISILNCLPSIG